MIPNTGRGPLVRRVRYVYQKPGQTHQHLYELAGKLEASRRKAKEQKEIQTELQAARAKSIDHSKELVCEVTDKKIEELFELLDSDRDGLVSAVRVNIDSLSKARLAIVAPLLAEMEEKRATLDFEGFSQAIHRLLVILNVHDRRILLDMKGRQRSSIEDMISIPFKVI